MWVCFYLLYWILLAQFGNSEYEDIGKMYSFFPSVFSLLLLELLLLKYWTSETSPLGFFFFFYLFVLLLCFLDYSFQLFYCCFIFAILISRISTFFVLRIFFFLKFETSCSCFMGLSIWTYLWILSDCQSGLPVNLDPVVNEFFPFPILATTLCRQMPDFSHSVSISRPPSVPQVLTTQDTTR